MEGNCDEDSASTALLLSAKSISKRTSLHITGLSRNLVGGGGIMATAECKPIRGSGSFAPSGVQGRSPWWGVRERSPPEADDMFALLNYICEAILTLIARFCCIRE